MSSPRPRFSPRPTWLHDDGLGALRFRGESLAPTKATAPLRDVIRAYAGRHGLSLNETSPPQG
ncbi:hypothetical protein [Streptomyces sp. NPDC050848]|uniref:hypothetical protein n=1 Tax=Streptomyces sp. NPDC050848 TaxID=3155791 RepID=UPI0033C67C7B